MPLWDLPLVLNKLSRKPFEPMATCSLQLFSWKMVFLIAITSASQVREMAAFRHDVPYLRVSENRITLVPDMSFLPKMVSEFHLHLEVHIQIFLPNPSTEEERHLTLLRYMESPVALPVQG